MASASWSCLISTEDLLRRHSSLTNFLASSMLIRTLSAQLGTYQNPWGKGMARLHGPQRSNCYPGSSTSLTTTQQTNMLANKKLNLDSIHKPRDMGSWGAILCGVSPACEDVKKTGSVGHEVCWLSVLWEENVFSAFILPCVGRMNPKRKTKSISLPNTKKVKKDEKVSGFPLTLLNRRNT